MTDTEKWSLTYNYTVSQLRALYQGDFESYVDGMSALEEFKNSHDPDDFVNDDGLTIPADLTALIKQALIEYSQEVDGFTTYKTYPVSSIDSTKFSISAPYNKIRSYASAHSIFAVAYSSGSYPCLYLCPLDSIYEAGQQFYKYQSNSGVLVRIIGTDWITHPFPADMYQYDSSTNELIKTVESQYNWSYFTIYSNSFPVTPNISGNGLPNNFYTIVTSTGGRIRVFNSIDAYKRYQWDQRAVYFGSGFYDKELSDITVSFDDLEKFMKGDFTDNFMDQLGELIGDDGNNLSEEDLQKLVDQILGKLEDIGGDIGSNTGETNEILGGIANSFSGLLDTLSGYFSSVLAYLESILEAIEALVWIEADDSISEDQKDLFDLIDKIWEDPENGSQEAADAISGSFSDVARGLTKKFPFSIPWDIHALFSVFANAGNPQPAVVSYSAEPSVMSYSAEPAVLYSGSGGIQAYTTDPEDLGQDVHNAPYFVLPLVIESWGINEQVVVDLKDFQTLSTLSRTLFSLLFAVFLIKFTISVIKIYKGGSGD